MRLRGARRFQMGGANNPVLAAGAAPASPGGVNPLPAVNMGGPTGGPFQSAAPAAGLGAAAPGLNPAAIQQAMAQRRMQAGMGMPGGGGMPAGGPPQGMQTNPLAQQMAARGAMPTPVGAPGAAGPTGPPNPQAMQALAAAMQARGGAPTPVGMGPGAPGPGAPPPGPPAANPILAANPGLAGAGMGFARGGEVVAPQWGDTDHVSRRARGGRISKFNSTKAAPGNLATHPGTEKKAKGGVIKRRPKAKKAPPLPPPYPGGDGQDALPPPAAPPAAAAAGPALGPPPPAGPPPGMRRGGKWNGGAIAKKKGGAVRRRPPGEEAPVEADDTEAMASGGKWIKKAIKKPGALHAQLGVPKGEKIPAKKLAKAAKASGKLGERARLAETLKKVRKAKGGKCVEDKDKDAMRKGGKCKMAAGGAAKQRKGFPKTIAPLRRAQGGRMRGCGAASKGCKFSGIY